MLNSSKLNKTTALIAGSFAIAASFAVNAGPLEYEDTREMKISASGISKLKIDAGAGFLKIVGEAGLDEVKVTADILAEDEDIKLTLEQSGDTIELEADAGSKSGFSWGGDSPKIDLTIRVPQRLILDVKDGSGSMSIKDIKNDVSVNDGSGSTKIRNIEGDLKVDDGSGSLDIVNVTGNLDVEDGSGSLDISQVTGTVNVEDGSGSLEVYDVGGLVTIDDGSGSIHVKKLRNGLTILEEGSGGLKMTDVKGPVSIK